MSRRMKDSVPEYKVVRHDGHDPAPFEICFTQEAFDSVLKAVGTEPPETGGKGFGPVNNMGIDVFEFDERGSSHRQGAVYSPNPAWGDERMDYWLDQPDEKVRLWTADVHSHPGRMGYPSPKAGPALGDLGYVEAIFEQNEMMQYFLLPILTNTGGDGPIEVHPWVVSRDKPHSPMGAELKICNAAEFPARSFNPIWQPAEQAPEMESAPVPESQERIIDRKRLSHLLSANIEVYPLKEKELWVGVKRGEVFVGVILPDDLRGKPPFVFFPDQPDQDALFTFHWRPDCDDLERRIAEVVKYALEWNTKTF